MNNEELVNENQLLKNLEKTKNELIYTKEHLKNIYSTNKK